jgi:hypothetical protein
VTLLFADFPTLTLPKSIVPGDITSIPDDVPTMPEPQPLTDAARHTSASREDSGRHTRTRLKPEAQLSRRNACEKATLSWCRTHITPLEDQTCNQLQKATQVLKAKQLNHFQG